MMQKNIEWMLSFIPTLIGAVVLAVSLFTSTSPILGGYLKLISISSIVQNFLRNSMELMKFLVGPGA
jgi:hypothetical protein